MIPTPIQQTLEWLIERKRFDAARELATAVRAHAGTPDAPTANWLASIFFRSYSYTEASELAQIVLNEFPDDVGAMVNAAKCFFLANRTTEAIALLRRALSQSPDDSNIRLELGIYLKVTGHFEEARRLIEESGLEIRATADHNQVRDFFLSEFAIRDGDFKSGLAKHLDLGRALERLGAAPRNDMTRVKPDTQLSGKKILVMAEGGLGDEILNVRFASWLKRQGAITSWCTNKGSLAPLLSRVDGIDCIIAPNEADPGHFDAWAPAMDLPVILGADSHDIFRSPYIAPLEANVRKWSTRLAPAKGLRVGLRWQSPSKAPLDFVRALHFDALSPLLDIPGVRFYSLHRDHGSEQLPFESVVTNWAPGLTDWDETAAAVANLDLVITSDTSLAHLAGAMGKRVWMFCPLHCYYPWLSPGNISIWYPTLTLIRQIQYGSWDAEIAAIASALRSYAASPNQYSDHASELLTRKA